MNQKTGVSDPDKIVSDNQDVKQLEEGSDKVAYETYRKAVNQYKRANEQLTKLQSEVELLSQGKMEAEGKKDELINSLRKQVSDLDLKLKSKDSSYAWNVVGAQLKSELASRGVKNPDKALSFAKSVNKEDLATIEVDDNYNVNSNGLKSFVDKFLSENNDMGFVAKSSVRDLTPGHLNLEKEDAKPVTKLTKEELIAALKQAQ